MKSRTQGRSGGFTLIELLVVIVIVAILATLSLAAFRSMRAKAASVAELSRMRVLGVAVIGWATDQNGAFPRSSHSATGHGERGWQREILPQLGYADTSRKSYDLAKPNELGIRPTDKPVRSPALNVYFELDPEYDDYEGAPQTWRTLPTLSRPSSTILLIMQAGTSDHVMAQYFTERVDDLPMPAQGASSATVLWADGRATLEAPGTVFDPSKGIDRFHPEKAR